MKKTLKRFMVLGLAMALFFSVGMTALADDDDATTATVTLDGVNGGQEAVAIKIFEVISSAQNGATIDYAAYGLNQDLMGVDGLYEYLGFKKGTTNTVITSLEGTAISADETDEAYEDRIIAYFSYLSNPTTSEAKAALQELTLLIATWMKVANTATYGDGSQTYWDVYDTDGDSYITETSDTTTELTTFSLESGYYFFRALGTTYTGSEGYYGILDTVDGINKTLVAKSTYPTVKKAIVEDDDTTSTSSTASIGDTVTYQVTTMIPNMVLYDDYHFAIEDKMSEGLTFTGITSVIVTNAEGGKVMELEAADEDGANDSEEIYIVSTEGVGVGEYVTFSLLIPDFYKLFEDDYGSYITVTYTAVINEYAEINGSNSNEAYLEYSTKPSDWSVYATSTSDTTYVYVFDFDFIKVDSTATTNPLEGAEFTLDRLSDNFNSGTYTEARDGDYSSVTFATDYVVNDVADGSYAVSVEEGAGTTVITVANGEIHIDGLDAGIYRLTEITAPDGYNLLDDPIIFEISYVEDTTSPGEIVSVTYTLLSGSVGTTMTTDNASVTHVKTESIAEGATSYLVDGDTVFAFTIKNVKGSLLPTTGGIGIILFSIVGVIAIVGGSYVMFYEPKRRRA